MAGDPVERSTDPPTPRRSRSLERLLLAVLVVAIVWARYGLDAALTYVVLPLCVLGIAMALADVIRTREAKGHRAAGRVLVDRSARVVLLGLVSVFIVGQKVSSDDGGDPPSDPCSGLIEQEVRECRPATTAAPTTQSPQFAPTTVAEAGRPAEPTCPPPGNQERRLSFTGNPPFCLNREMDYVATVETNYGPFDINLNMEGAPWTVNNFAFLAGWHFYDGVPLETSSPRALATSFFVGEPVDPEESSAAPGYTLTFESTQPPYPEDPYIVMLDGLHPNRFEIAISRSRRAEIEGNPGNYPLLGDIPSGDDVIVQHNFSDLGPRLPSEVIVIKSVTIKEVPPG